MRNIMQNKQDDAAWRRSIISKVKARASYYNISFLKTHPVSGRMHPSYPSGYYIQLTFNSAYRYTRTPPQIFENEAQLDRFLATFT
jgi:hypothetical protein